jgi:hypothetical protein
MGFLPGAWRIIRVCSLIGIGLLSSCLARIGFSTPQAVRTIGPEPPRRDAGGSSVGSGVRIWCPLKTRQMLRNQFS